MHGTPLMQRIHARFMAETPFETVFAQTLRGWRRWARWRWTARPSTTAH